MWFQTKIWSILGQGPQNHSPAVNFTQPVRILQEGFMQIFGSRRSVFTVLLTILATLAVGGIGLFLLSLTAETPKNLGVHDGRLAGCPLSPNCVSTQAEDHDHWIAPISVSSTVTPPIEVLAEIVRSLPRTTIVEQSNHYLRVEFRSRLFRFCDDVEFYFEDESDRVHFRSASRVGHSDLGVNRDRMEMIRQRFTEMTVREDGQSPEASSPLRRTAPMIVISR